MFRFSVAFINNFICVCLIWLIVLIALYYGSEAIYDTAPPLKTSDTFAQSNKINSENTLNAKDQTKNENLTIRLAEGNLERGQRLFSQCAVCHSAAQNGPNRVGPNLWNIVERPVASLDNFHYSTAMRQLGQSGAVWNYEQLDAFLTAPQRAVKATNMAYPGMRDAEDRADLLLYLRNLSDAPKPLPNK